jgi:predicted RNA binding protein YcfA (HicA-like mRNA interferase family)
LKEISGKAFARAIEKQGWVLLRIAGSHHIYGKDGSIVRLSVQIHGNNALKTRVAQSFDEASRYF